MWEPYFGSSFVGQEFGWGSGQLKDALLWVVLHVHFWRLGAPSLTLSLQERSHPPGLFRAVKDSHRRAASDGQTSYMETLRPDSGEGNENCQSPESWACQLVQHHFRLIRQVKQLQHPPGFHSRGHRPHLLGEQ